MVADTNSYYFGELFRRTNPFGESGGSTKSETEGRTDMQYSCVLELFFSCKLCEEFVTYICFAAVLSFNV